MVLQGINFMTKAGEMMPYYQTEIRAGRTIEIYRSHTKRMGKHPRGDRVGKTPEEIRKTFNIQNDFTPEEEQQIREENQWCMDNL